MQTSFRLLFPALLVALALPSPAAEKLQLRSHWEVGKIYKQNTVTDMTMTVPGLGPAGAQQTAITQSLEIKVTQDPAGPNKLAEVKFAAIKGSMSMLGQVMQYDSTNPAKSSPFLQQSFGAMVGKGFTLVYDKDDNYVDLRGAESLTATPLGKTSAMDGKQLAEMFRKSNDLALPKDPVAVGDSWNFEQELDMPPLGKMIVKGKGTFEGISERDGRKEARLLVEGSFSVGSSSAPGGANQLVKFGEGSKFTGVSLFDLDRKVISSYSADMTLNLNIAGAETPVKQKITTTLTGIEDAR